MNEAAITLNNGMLSLTVDPKFGGRITACCFDGRNALMESGPQTGSTFWPSPQSMWDWPPLSTLDSEPYQVLTSDTQALIIRSAVCPLSGLSLEKQFRVIDGGFAVTYRLQNHRVDLVQVAPWEISRVAGGLTFYQSNESPLPISTLHVDESDGTFWHHYTPAGEENNLKLFANHSGGWLANLHNGLLLVKSFPQISADKIAPGEAEVEIYAHGDPKNAYIEIEQQGAYSALAPNAKVDWTVQWRLAPCEHSPSASSSILLKSVKELL